jgi:endonuclease/exonuclease/phosphatase family metal-dependent hydrolase
VKRRYLRILVSILCVAANIHVGYTLRGDGVTHFDPSVLRVITYNVQFLPDPVSWKNERPNPEYRARRIGDELRRFDVVGLQEVFHAQHREQVLDRTRTAWNGQLHQLVSPTPKGFHTSGGCLLMTRRPILNSSSTVFVNYSKPSDYGQRADGHAAKGVLHARIARSPDEPGNYIDVFVTHLEARADALRPLQYQEMADFIRKTIDTHHAFLVLGDMNTYGMIEFQKDPKSQYSHMMRELQGAQPQGEVMDLWPMLKGDALGGTTEQESSEIGKRVDYLLLGNPRQGGVRLKPKRIDVQLYQDEQVGALSDHNAVVAELDWPSDKEDGAASR